ncbi:MAG: response regulator [Draconibacterium sp.]|nr:response regulator [Draconibacterium sp.]
MKILLADDSQLILDRLQDMLGNCCGVEIVGSLKNGTDTLKAIKNLLPDLVIIDINMPGLTGLQVLDEVKKENHKTKFMVLTFYASNYYRKKAMKLGSDYFLSKVDDFEKVSGVVDELLLKENSNNKIIN